MQPHFKGEAKTASRPLTCPDSRKWSASLLLGYVWSWLLPMGGGSLRTPQNVQICLLFGLLPSTLPWSICPEPGPGCSLLDRAMVSVTLFPAFSAEQSPTRRCLPTQPPPQPSWLPSARASCHSPHSNSSSCSAQPPSVCNKNLVPSLGLPSLPLGAHFLPLLPY